MSQENAMTRIGVLAALLLLCTLLTGAPAFAGVKIAKGSGAWEDPGNWLPPGVPGLGDDVVIGFGDTVTTDGTRKKIGSLGLQGKLVGKDGKDVDLEVTGGVAVSPGAVLEGGKGTRTTPKGGDVTIDAGGHVENHGTIAGGQSINGRTGGKVDIDSGQDVRNRPTGTIKGGRGGNAGDKTTNKGGTGGDVTIKGKNVDNDGTVRGGHGGVGIGGNIVNGPGGDGGRVTVGADDEVDNSGRIEGGDGNDAGTGPEPKAAGSGGKVDVTSKNKPTRNTGTIQGGAKGKPHRGGREGRTGDVRIDGKKGVILIGGGAVLHGGDVIIQADDGPMTLSGLGDRAIEAFDGRVVLLSPGRLDLRGTTNGFQPRLAAKRAMLVIADSILVDLGVNLRTLTAPSPDVRRRAQFFAEGGPRIGTPYRLVAWAPEDANHLYFCACALSAVTGVELNGFGRMGVDPDWLFWLSAYSIYPFVNFAGQLDSFGQGTLRLDVPNVAPLVGLKLYFQAVMAMGVDFTNLTKTRPVTIGM